MSYKFVQMSEIGFNNSLSTDIEINKYIESARKKAFEKAIELCIKERVTALLICGNLYDEKYITYESARTIKKGFAKLKAQNIAIVYAHGKLDKGTFIDSIEKEIIEIKSKYTKYCYSLPFDIDTIYFSGIGYSQRLIFQDEFLEEKKIEAPAIGLMYIDPDSYSAHTRDLLHNRLAKSNITYWALGGSAGFVDMDKDTNYCYSGYLAPKSQVQSGCVLVAIDNKLRVNTKLVDICKDMYVKIYLDDVEKCRDIYQLVEKCIITILKNKKPGHNMIITLELLGQCTCYNKMVNNKKALQDEIAKITKTKLSINVNNLCKSVRARENLEDDTEISEMLEECYQLYDDEDFYNKIIDRLKTKRVFYSEEDNSIDKKKILEGVDSIIIESAMKEDSHDY